MQKSPLKSGVIGVPALALLLSAQIVFLCPAYAQLKGGVATEHMLPQQDPFGAQGAAEEEQPGPPPGWGMQRGQVQAAQPPPGPPKRPFGLSLEDNSMPEEPQQPPARQQPMQPRMGQAPPNQDPDDTPEMQLLWDAWHRRVAGEIFTRFNLFAKAAFRHSPPLVAVVTYRVSRDGRVDNVQLVKGSTNLFFNLLITQVVKSMNGNTALLQYPPGSRRQIVEKVGTFSQNVGTEGFSHQTGDAERIVGR